MKKTIAIICAALAFMLCLTSCDSFSINDDGFAYMLQDDGTYTIVAYIGVEAYITIPSTYEGIAVTSISPYAFSDHSSISDVEIPDSIKSIGNYAFQYCIGLASIDIPASVTDIGECAFETCENLTSINVSPDNPAYKSVDGDLYTKDGSTLVKCISAKTNSSFVIPSGVTAIGDYAFVGCTALTEVTIPDGVTSIGNYAFWARSNLASIDVPDSVTVIGECAFQACDSLTSVGLTENSKLESIGNYAFRSCDVLTEINIPSGVTSIGEGVFDLCPLLSVSAILPPSAQ